MRNLVVIAGGDFGRKITSPASSPSTKPDCNPVAPRAMADNMASGEVGITSRGCNVGHSNGTSGYGVLQRGKSKVRILGYS